MNAHSAGSRFSPNHCTIDWSVQLHLSVLCAQTSVITDHQVSSTSAHGISYALLFLAFYHIRVYHTHVQCSTSLFLPVPCPCAYNRGRTWSVGLITLITQCHCPLLRAMIISSLPHRRACSRIRIAHLHRVAVRGPTRLSRVSQSQQQENKSSLVGDERKGAASNNATPLRRVRFLINECIGLCRVKSILFSAVY